MKVLLTGGTGVLSSDIAKLCIDKGYDTYILNRGKSGRKVNEKIHILIADVRNEEEVKNQVKGLEFDVVVDFLSFNTKELSRMLNIFNHKCKQFIFISSATVYQNVEKGKKISESDALGSPWDYSIDKIACEKLLEENKKLYGQEYTIVRPYVTYNNTRIPFGIISKKKQWSLINRILNDKPILLWEDGRTICTLTDSRDFAVGIVGLFLNDKAYGQAFHITSDNTLTWEEALKDMGQAIGKQPKIVKIPADFIIKEMPELKGPLLGDRTLDRQFNNTKIKNAVPDFNAQILFKDGIQETINYYMSNPSMQKIDYHWEAQIDYVIEKYEKKTNEKQFSKRELNKKQNKENMNYKADIIYKIFRYFYPISERIYQLLKKIKHKIG